MPFKSENPDRNGTHLSPFIFTGTIPDLQWKRKEQLDCERGVAPCMVEPKDAPRLAGVFAGLLQKVAQRGGMLTSCMIQD